MIEFKKEASTIQCIPQVDITASNVPELRNKMIEHLDKEVWEELVLDCSKVNTLDSIGVNLIVGLFKKSSSKEKKFKINGCNESLRKVLKLFRLDDKFNVD